jgi:hypothetical protein
MKPSLVQIVGYPQRGRCPSPTPSLIEILGAKLGVGKNSMTSSEITKLM